MHYLIIAVLAFGLSLMGCEGKTGPAGPSGSTGAAGPAGPAGPQGSTGPQGATGPQGETGPMGPAGADGAPGPAGQDGKDGAPGEKGDQGDPGPKGDQGDPGPKGDQGEPGPKGDQGDPGEDGAPGAPGAGIEPGAIQDAIDGVVGGGILADIHHILLIQDGQKPADARRVDAPGFDGSIKNVVLIAGEDTQITVKAASQDGTAIPVETVWESGDPTRVSVEDGLITGNKAATGVEITLAIVGRGISMKFKVDVVGGAADKVTIDGPNAYTIAVGGGTIDLVANVLDKGGIRINGATGITVTWHSSNPAVVSVDKGVVSAVSAGRASVVASSGGKTSAPVHFTVTDIADPDLRIRPLYITDANRTIMVPVHAEDDEENKKGSIIIPVLPTDTGLNRVMAEIQEKDANGNWVLAQGESSTVTAMSQNPDVIAFGMNDTPATASGGEITLVIEASHIKGLGSANIVLSYDGAHDAAVVVKVAAAPAN